MNSFWLICSCVLSICISISSAATPAPPYSREECYDRPKFGQYNNASETGLNYFDAKEYCWERCKLLATIKNSLDYEELQGKVHAQGQFKDEPIWLGGYCEESRQCKWDDGGTHINSAGYTRWENGSPNIYPAGPQHGAYNCLIMKNKTWSNANCLDEMHFYCQDL